MMYQRCDLGLCQQLPPRSSLRGFCSPGVAVLVGKSLPPASEAPKSSALASFDPCTALTPEELQSLGVAPSEKEPVDEGMEDAGCDFTGEENILSLTKVEQDDLASWKGRSDNFDRLDPNIVADQQGLVGVTKKSTGKGVCRQIIGVGGGSVTAQMTFVAPETGKTAAPPAPRQLKLPRSSYRSCRSKPVVVLT